MPRNNRSLAVAYIGTLWLTQHDDERTPLPRQAFCAWQPPEALKTEARCYRWQHEIATSPEHGRAGDHIQIFIRFKRQRRYTDIDRILDLEPHERHYEPIVNGITGMQHGWDYCGKEESRHCGGGSFGERPSFPGAAGQGAGRTANGRGADPGQLAGWVVHWFQQPRGGRGLREFQREPEGAEASLRFPGGVRFIEAVQTAPTNRPDEWSKRSVFIYFGKPGNSRHHPIPLPMHLLRHAIRR